MYNDILTLGPITIHGYGLMIALGILFAVILGQRLAKKFGLDADKLTNLAYACLIFGFVGAKLLYCIVEFDKVIADPMEFISGSGFVVYGGIIAGVIAGIVYTRKYHMDFWKYFDIAMPCVLLAQGFGRIGCFLAGCCYGKETDSIIGVVFPASSLAPSGVKLIPTQLISSIGCFMIVGVLLYFLNKKHRDGTIGSLYLIFYSIGRFIIEFFRNDYRGSIGILSTSQFIAILTLILGIILYMRMSIKEKRYESNKN